MTFKHVIISAVLTLTISGDDILSSCTVDLRSSAVCHEASSDPPLYLIHSHYLNITISLIQMKAFTVSSKATTTSSRAHFSRHLKYHEARVLQMKKLIEPNCYIQSLAGEAHRANLHANFVTSPSSHRHPFQRRGHQNHHEVLPRRNNLYALHQM